MGIELRERHHVIILALLSVCIVAGCGDDDPGAAPDADAGTADADGVDAVAGDADVDARDVDAADADSGPMPGDNGFVICGLIPQPGAAPSSYAAVVATLDGSETIDLGATVSLPPFAACVGDGRTLFVGSGEAPEVTRWEIGEDGTFTRGNTVSFMGLGIATISARPGLLQVVSDTKGYYIDVDNLQVVVWNPLTMEITTTLSFDSAAPEPGQTFGLSPALRAGDRVVAAGGYGDMATGVLSQTLVMVSIDVNTDAVNVVETTTCGGNSNTSVVLADDGWIYASNGARTVARYRLGTPGTFPPCLVRFDPAAQAFDPTYRVALGDLTGEPTTGELAIGPGGQLLTLAYNETLVPITDATTDAIMLGTPAWQYYAIADPATATTATRVESLMPTSGTIATLEVAGVVYAPRLAMDFSRTVLVNISDIANPVDQLEAPGAINHVSPL
ncbi:MAG: hypothetical protein AAGF12_21950 [Myxococcota bacterium]